LNEETREWLKLIPSFIKKLSRNYFVSVTFSKKNG